MKAYGVKKTVLVHDSPPHPVQSAQYTFLWLPGLPRIYGVSPYNLRMIIEGKATDRCEKMKTKNPFLGERQETDLCCFKQKFYLCSLATFYEDDILPFFRRLSLYSLGSPMLTESESVLELCAPIRYVPVLLCPRTIRPYTIHHMFFTPLYVLSHKEPGCSQRPFSDHQVPVHPDGKRGFSKIFPLILINGNHQKYLKK
jgi:hypothetical protein